MKSHSEFVSFYEVNWNSNHTKKVVQVYNGFSSMGEIPIKWINEFSDIFEPEAENIYVSCHYLRQLKTALSWAEKFPKNKFVIGGCVFQSQKLSNTITHIPDNALLTSATLQEHFKEPVKKWYLDFPSELPIRYTFYNGQICYWKKCNFCIATNRDMTIQNMSYDYTALEDAPNGAVILSNPSTPLIMLPLLSTYKQFFVVFSRASKKELDVLKRIDINWKKFQFLIGIEFPSNRMLKLMNKGVTVQECIRMIAFLQSKKANFLLYMISGWPELLRKDVEEAKDFLGHVEKKVGLIHRPLIYQRDVGELKGWVTYESYQPELPKGSIEANAIWLDILQKWSPRNKYEEQKYRRCV